MEQAQGVRGQATASMSIWARWLGTAGLLLLTAVPVLAGVMRMVGLATGATVTPENARFFAAPLPVTLHIVGASLFCVLGAFQFAAGLRLRRPGWHRAAGRVLIVAGVVAALSGLWMTRFYPLPPGLQGPVLYGFRLFIGSAMVAALILAWVTAWRRDFRAHRAWIMRAYAIGQGAGTQAVIIPLWMLALGQPVGLSRDLLMVAAWLINLVVAEWIIRRPARRPSVSPVPL